MASVISRIRENREAARKFDNRIDSATSALNMASKFIESSVGIRLAIHNLEIAEALLHPLEVSNAFMRLSRRATRSRAGVYADRKALLDEVRRDVIAVVETRDS